MIEKLKGDWVTDDQCLNKVCQKVDEIIDYLNKQEPKEPTYPCDDCGKLRTKEEGGTVFTVCDECWEKHYKPKSSEELELRKDVPQDTVREIVRKHCKQLLVWINDDDVTKGKLRTHDEKTLASLHKLMLEAVGADLLIKTELNDFECQDHSMGYNDAKAEIRAKIEEVFK
jgi:Zn finger protein HypA/HybF involved in hydrogenase expression